MSPADAPPVLGLQVMYTPFLFFYSFSFFDAKLLQLLELVRDGQEGFLQLMQP